MARNDAIFFIALAGIAGLAYYVYSLSQETTPDYYDPNYDPYQDQGFLDMSSSTLPRYSPSQLVTSPAGATNIANWEGKRNSAYQDIAGHWTIGRGHLIRPGDGLSPQSVLSDAQVDDLFADDLAEAEQGVRAYVHVPITQGMFDALADFVYNFGTPKFATSDLLRFLNAQDYKAAGEELPKWVHAGGVVVPQLEARRSAAYSMFFA